ncbi:MAG: ATP-dependent helicase, partial [Planctomycetes bacterium]|nr:ATP-dependent helicase [Planctomycetota bacterium]
SKRPLGERPRLVTCMDESQQTDEVCRSVLAHYETGKTLMEQSVLFRTGHHSAHLEVELSRRNIPFRKFGGLKFIETAHIKDMLAVLRILENPYDEISWFRVLLLLGGIGPKTARRVMDELGVRSRADTADGDAANVQRSPLTRLANKSPKVPPAAREAFEALRSTLVDCSGVSESQEQAGSPGGASSGKASSLVTQIERIKDFYEPVFERVYENSGVRLRDIDQLAQIASTYRSRRSFITDLTLDPPEAASDLAQPPFLEEDWLTLSTIHSAKGCEWTVVHVIHAADGMIPSDMATGSEAEIEEERRLFYVAMTRAKDFLNVYFPLRYYHRRFSHGDAHTFAQLTRFMSDDVKCLFDIHTAMPTQELEEREAEAKSKDPYTRVTQLLQKEK